MCVYSIVCAEPGRGQRAGWTPFLDEVECCLWRTPFLDGVQVLAVEAGYRLWISWTPFLDGPKSRNADHTGWIAVAFWRWILKWIV